MDKGIWLQVTGEEAQSSASGDTHLVRTTSSSDANGNLQVMQREVANTRKTGPNAQETKTTFYFLKVYDGLSRDSYFAIIDAAKRLGLTEEVMLRKKVDSNSEWCWMPGSRRNQVGVVPWHGTQAEVTGLWALD